MSETSKETRTELEQLLNKGKDNEEEILESVEENIEDLTDREYHYSLDIIEADNNSIRIGVYGVEGYELPSQRTVANAMARQFGWTPGFEEGVSTEDCYHMRVENREDDSESL